MNIILVHGSVETSCDPPYIASLQQAALAGSEVIDNNLIDAVEKAVIVLENEPLFNAGYGSVLNLDGQVEMDAAIMDGTNLRCGAVAAIQDVQNPIAVARKVMEQTSHVLLAGQGATAFARKMSFPYFNPATDLQRSSWEKISAALAKGEKPNYSSFTGLPTACDTVGCVAVSSGCTAAGSSTGGSFLKLPGRVGDTPVIGGGIYASEHGAAICTGLGEMFIRLQAAAWTVNLLAQGVTASEAARSAIRRLFQFGARGGMLVVAANGQAAAVHNTSSFPVALAIDGAIVKDFQPELL